MASSSNIVLQQAGPHHQLFNNGPPPPNYANNNGRPTNQINNAIINNLPLSPAENAIDFNELNGPFFDNHVRHNNDREPMPPSNNNGPIMNENQGPPPAIEHPQYNNNNNGDWPMNNHKQMAIDKPRITHLDVKCEKNLMKVFIE